VCVCVCVCVCVFVYFLFICDECVESLFVVVVVL
jgi:hypothetical protein